MKADTARAKLTGRTRFNLSQLMRAASLAAVIKVIGMTAGYVFSWTVARFGGAEAWGVFSLSLMLITIGSIIGRLGFDTATLRLVAQFRAQGKNGIARGVYARSMLVVLPVAVAVSLGLFVSAAAISAFFRGEIAAGHVRLASLCVVPTAALLLSAEALRASRRVSEYLTLNLVVRYAAGAAIFLVAVSVTNLEPASAAILSYFVGVAATAFAAWMMVRRAFEGVSAEWADEVSVRALFTIGLPLALASSMQFVKGYIDTIMLGIYLDASDVGVYNIALKMALIVALPLMAVNTFSAPRFAEAHGLKDMAALNTAVRSSGQLIFYVSVPLAIIFLVIPGFALSMFGAEFTRGATALRILAVGSLVNALSGSVGYLLQMTGGEKFFQRITITAAVMGVGLNVLLVPAYGIEGAAVSTAAAAIVWNVASVVYVKRRYGILTIFTPWRPHGGE